jgi:hypothetical protein
MESTTCPACGAVLPARAIFCRKCGTRLQPDSMQAPAQLQQGLDTVGQETPPEPQEPPEPPPERPFDTLTQPERATPPEAVNAALESFGAPPADFAPAPQGAEAAPESPEALPTWAGISAQPLAHSSPAAPTPRHAAAKPGSKIQSAQSILPARKKRKAGVVVLIAAIVLVVLAGGVLGVVILKQNHILLSKAPAPTSTPRPTFTPTPDRTRGFRQFNNSKYSLLYPGNWAAVPAQSISKDDEEFIKSPQEMFEVQVIAQVSGQPTPQRLDDVTCQTFFGANNKPDAPTMVNFANQQWTRETCEGSIKGTNMQVLVESTVYQNRVYTLAYNAPSTSFASDQQQYFTPMEQSFTFLT